MFRRPRIRPVSGTPYGVARTWREERLYVRRSTPTVQLNVDSAGFARRETSSVDRWDYIGARPRTRKAN